MKVDKFWKNKKVLVLGHTGFKGSWLTVWLRELGADIIGYGLEPKRENDNYVLCKLNDKITDIKGDICNKELLNNIFNEYKPEIVINLVESKTNRGCTSNIYERSIVGTLNVLECIKNTDSVKVAIMSTSDNCYDIREQMWGYREDDRLGGDNPESVSSACAGMIIDSYRNEYLDPQKILSHGKSVATVRIGKVVGGGEWNENEVIPACANAFSQKDSVVIRNPEAIRPWQHILEPIRGILILAQKMYENPGCYCENWNLGAEYSSCLTVLDAVTKFQKEFRKGEILELDEEDKNNKRGTVVLDITKAKYRLGWIPKWTTDKTLAYTADWYKNYKTKDVYALCRNHIEKYSLL